MIQICISPEDKKTLATLSSTVIASNHTSLIDIVILISLTNDATCIVKGKLFNNFFIRFILANAFVSNGGNPEELISHSVAALKKGYNLIVFPEGTRSSKAEKLQRGTAHIALESMAVILVVRIDPDQPHLRKGLGWRDAAEKQVLYNISLKTLIKTADIINPKKNRSTNARAITAMISEAF